MNFDRLFLMRTAARVERMHTMPPMRRQTVGEHTFGVIAILLEVCTPSANLLKAALYHDAPETITGDVPAIAKWRYPIIEEGLELAEQKIINEFELGYYYEQLDFEERKLLKYADYMELAMWALEECYDGNLRAATVCHNILQAFKTRKLIEVTMDAAELYEYVATDFEQSFAKTLEKRIPHGHPKHSE